MDFTVVDFLTGCELFVILFVIGLIVYAIFCRVIRDTSESWHTGKLIAKKKFQEKLDEEIEKEHGKTRVEWERARNK